MKSRPQLLFIGVGFLCLAAVVQQLIQGVWMGAPQEWTAAQHLPKKRIQRIRPRKPEPVTSGARLVHQKAPDFKVYDAKGHPIQLSRLRGKWVLLNFWGYG